MAITVFEACKKRKRTPKKIICTSRFSSIDDSSMDFSRSFRDNIKEFLKRCSDSEDYKLGGTNPVWCTLLVNESSGVVFPLYIVEEFINNSSSSQHQPLCDFCRFVGWSHHFVSKRNYHLIVPDDDKWNKPLKKDSLKQENHLLHGVIHCNGFGHLLCIEIESNSNYLNGEDLMSLWDHLCACLKTRDISVHDLSKKGSMDLRLLNGVAYGRSWFGKWGYKLCRGSFGVRKHEYNRAIEILSSLELSKITTDFSKRKQGKLIGQIVQTYSDISETQLVTISDLLYFMLAFESKPLIQRKTALALASFSSKSSRDQTTNQPKASLPSYPSDYKSLASFVAKLDARWPERRLERVVEVIFQILQIHGARMLRQDLRDAVRQHIGDTGLIDFVLKHIDKVIVGNQVIVRANKPVSKLLEFSLEDISDGATLEKKAQSHTDISTLKLGLNVRKDLLFLYKNVLLGYPDYHAVAIAARVILDCKHFFKEWQYKSSNEDALLTLICQVRPSYDELANELTWPLPPGEPVMAPECATVFELKLTVQCALRDTYCVMDNFVVNDIEIGGLVAREEGQDLLKCGLEDGMKVWVRGSGLDLDTKLRYQGGDNDWTVDCKCGAKDDDGERMVACDACHVWQHTRCNSIKDDASPPTLFLCRMCNCRMKKSSARCISAEKNRFGRRHDIGPQ
ncbi:PHD finger protein At2g01810 [Ricinus communis]|uniref:DNA binding protein, putative n=1 Tax=Ricinus communis TaxID=3988 RepID=B9SNG2_RICCO|nr:PHD finger protein At2g01810 [Ricinus communis]EEF34840.1 DNA binding protein, putative [Ricinus communis]|eukprot:XP_002527531.1 PHD finger protein At2g01810 [Ricinus communis]